MEETRASRWCFGQVLRPFVSRVRCCPREPHRPRPPPRSKRMMYPGLGQPTKEAFVHQPIEDGPEALQEFTRGPLCGKEGFGEEASMSPRCQAAQRRRRHVNAQTSFIRQF